MNFSVTFKLSDKSRERSSSSKNFAELRSRLFSKRSIVAEKYKGERYNFEKSNFRMTNILNLKINERSNVERPNLRVTTIENENSEDKASKFIYIKG